MTHITKNNTLFPTVISEFEYIADEHLIDAIQNEDLIDNKVIYHTRASKDNELHKKNEYKDLVNKILETTKEVCHLYDYEYKSLEITNLWINISQKGDCHSPHTHSNNIFSGVWYPFSGKYATPIMFSDPRPTQGHFSPKGKINEYTTTLMSFQNKKNLGLIFPSWLTHYVPPALSTRISLSWNIIVRGEYGNSNDLQNAHI
tara:strand:+ start:143 stop:748 length:606 start_codon:yes stop_codon:yes gene_type:complete